MDTQSPLKLGIVGCGYQGGIMARAIAADNVFQVIACADPNQAAAARVAAIARNPAVYTSIQDLLARADVDAVIVATLHDALFACALAAIRAGKHVLAEKPISLRESEAIQLEEALDSANVCFMSGYSFRHISALQKVRELLLAGAVGEIHTITGSIGVGPMSKGWKANLETGGGPMYYVGSHLVDQFLWYIGDDPAEVYANICYHADTRADETTWFQIRFARGTVAQGMVTQTATGFYNNLDIFGQQGRISLRGIGFSYGIEVLSSALPAYSQPTSFHLPQLEDLRILMHLPQLSEFAQAIREQRQPSCPVTDGRHVLKVIDAIKESDRTNQIVRIA